MTLEQNIKAILECNFSIAREEIIEAATKRIMEQISRQNTKTCYKICHKWDDVLKENSDLKKKIHHYECLIEYSRDFDCSIEQAERDLLVSEPSNCTECILDGTDACKRGAGRAVDDTICEDFMEGE